MSKKYYPLSFLLSIIISIGIAVYVLSPTYSGRSDLRFENVNNQQYILMHPEYSGFRNINTLNIPVSFVERMYKKSIKINIFSYQNTSELIDGFNLIFIANNCQLKKIFVNPKTGYDGNVDIPIDSISDLSIVIDKIGNEWNDLCYIDIDHEKIVPIAAYAFLIFPLFFLAINKIFCYIPDVILKVMHFIVLIGSVFAPSYIRGRYVSKMLYNERSRIFEVIREDCEFISILFVFLAVFFCIKNKYIKTVFGVVILTLFVFYVADVTTLYTLNSRLYINDIIKYCTGMNSIAASTLGEFISNRYGVIIFVSVIAFVTTFMIDIRITVKKVIILFMLSVFGGFFFHQESAMTVITNNFIRNNTTHTRYNEYSMAFIAKNMDKYKKMYKKVSHDGLDNNYNVILIIYESLSNYISNFIFDEKDSSANSLIPNFDAISKKAFYSKRHYNNTYNSSSGNFCILSGHFAIPSPDVEYPWGNEKMLGDCIAHDLNKKNYTTIYITPQLPEAGSLDNLAKLAGFKDRIFLGHELFAGKTAINDKELYNKFLTYTDNIKNNFFGCIVTTTTHPPYVDPLTNSYDINKAFKFSDEALDWFIKELSRKKFFDNGIVVITGDHRAWEPISQKEKRIYGDFAGAMTPVSIIGPNLNGEIPFDIQSCDINPSLGYLLKQTQDFLPWQKNIFTGKEEKNSRIILHHSGIDRDKIYYKHESNTGYVLLDGDNTCASTSTDQYPVDVINLYRILF